MKSTKTGQKNRVRGVLWLPPDVRLDEIDWKPSVGEKRAEAYEAQRKRKLEWLAESDANFEKAEKEYRKARIAVLQKMIDADLKRIRELS